MKKTAKSIDKDLCEQHSTSPTQTHRHTQTRVVKPKNTASTSNALTLLQQRSSCSITIALLSQIHRNTHTQQGEKVKKLKVKENNYHCKSMNMRIYFLTHIIANYYS